MSSVASTLSFQGQGKVITGTVDIDFASCGNGAVVESSVTITGAATGDFVKVFPPTAGMTAGLTIVDCFASAADTVKVRMANLSGGTVNEASATYNYIIIRA